MSKEKINEIEIMRHSISHVLAAAVLQMFPEAKFGVGPAVENGFYYDFDLPRTLIPEDLPILEEKMKDIIKSNYKFERVDTTIEEAEKDFKELGQGYKLELINDLKNEGNKKVSLYRTGSFVDLCSGPHIDSTGEIKSDAFKLMRISGAYWKNDESNKQLQRIYGVAFESKKDLKKHLQMIEEAQKRDHKKIGRELDLFSFHSEAPGSAFWHPKGMAMWNELEQLGKSIRKKYNYLEIQTPILAKNNLWQVSGHWDHYKDSMFYFDQNDETYCLKPMDCPFNIKIYETKQRSYKDLPIRYTEIGRVLRNEKSGELNGLFRVQHITQDDSHIFLTENQIEKEISILLKMVKEYYKIFGIEPKLYLSTRPEDFIGKKEDWDQAEKDLENALKKEKLNYDIKEGDGAFYGPKIDIDIKDALGRPWQLATIQLDFQLPQRFNLEYIGNDGQKKTPILIHAAVFGSLERFIGIMTEHYAGVFPTWLSPIQTKIIPVSEEKFGDYAKEINDELIAAGVRSEIDDSAESLGKRIRDAEKQKIPYMLVVGEKEVGSKSVTIRKHGSKNQESKPAKEFIKEITEEITNKK